MLNSSVAFGISLVTGDFDHVDPRSMLPLLCIGPTVTFPATQLTILHGQYQSVLLAHLCEELICDHYNQKSNSCESKSRFLICESNDPTIMSSCYRVSDVIIF